LEEANKFQASLPPANVIVVDHGRIVAQWGNPAMRVKLSSQRKSLLSALYGIHVGQGVFNLDDTLAQLGLDDDPPLTSDEKQATLRMLLQARSGVYHPFVAGTPAMRAAMPARGSHPPGAFWYYNNWDFNALGTIFESRTNTSIADAFLEKIARKIGMEDFRPEDMYYVRAPKDAPETERSVHPAYQFRLTARDMARFGYLYLRQGRWQGSQVLPADWIEESTTSYSDTGKGGGGYGYLWWINGFGLGERSFSAEGALAKYIIVFPDSDIVVVYQNHTEFPDEGQGLSDQAIAKLPTISHTEMGRLLMLILGARKSS
jgi:CubicO group peptidase (beta-lactamase class C family)